jgi:hypothetical protein
MNLESIENAFMREGFISIPFTFNGAGHPIITATLGADTQANILVDTGASANLLDYDFASTLGLPLTPTGEKGGGTGGLTIDIFSIGDLSMKIGAHEIVFDNFLAMDFTSIKESLTAGGITEDFQGILGFGFFKMTKCFIDYGGNRIFIHNQSVVERM